MTVLLRTAEPAAEQAWDPAAQHHVVLRQVIATGEITGWFTGPDLAWLSGRAQAAFESDLAKILEALPEPPTKPAVLMDDGEKRTILLPIPL